MQAVLDFLKGILSGENGVAAQIVSIFIAVNMGLTGVKSALDYMKDKTKSDVDNKISDVLGKVLGAASWVIDLIQGNKEHK